MVSSGRKRTPERVRARERTPFAWYSPAMRRSLIVFLVAAACGGGSKKSTTPPPPLPEPTAQAKPEPKEEPKEAEKPQVPAGPVEITLPAPKVTVKLVSPGKGKKIPLKHTSKAGDKQVIELTMDFAGKQTAPPELGGTQ